MPYTKSKSLVFFTFIKKNVSSCVRHPASSYVQGINDLLTPFLAVFLAEKQNMRVRKKNQGTHGSQQGSHQGHQGAGPSSNAGISSTTVEPPFDLRSLSLDILTEQDLSEVEADSYFCLTKLLDSMLDHYTPGQPGIHRMIKGCYYFDTGFQIGNKIPRWIQTAK